MGTANPLQPPKQHLNGPGEISRRVTLSRAHAGTAPVANCALHSRISYSCSWTAARRKGKKREFGPTQSALLRGDAGARGAQEGTSVAELNLSLKLKVRYWRSPVKLKILKEIEIPTLGRLSSLFVYILLHRKCMNINKTNSKSNIFIKPTLPTL